MHKTSEDRSVQKKLLTVEATCKALSLSRTKINDLMRSGDIASVKVGSRRMILAASVDDYIDGLLVEAA